MSWRYRPSLDGLRMLAMYLIVLFHANVPGVEGSFIAVNLFFVLSGYLVTNVVLNEMDKTGTLNLGQFYARRVRRLLPAALVAIVGISFVFLLVSPVVRRLSAVGDAQSALLYVANWRFIQQGNDYFATGVEKSPFLHFWTLGIEEQFYLVFPLLLLLLARSSRRWVMLAGLSVVFALSVGAQVYWAGVDPLRAYYGTDARLYQLVIGAMLAVALRMWQVHLSTRAASAVAGLGLLGFVVLSGNVVDLSQANRGFLGTVACVLLIGGLMVAEDQPLGRLFGRRTPVYLGKISYSTYLWHWPAILVLEQVLTVGPLSIAVMAAVLSTAMAAASAELVEDPIRRSKALDKFRWRTVGVGLTASVLLAVAVVPQVLESERAPAIAGSDAAPVPAPPEVERVVKDAEPVPDDVDWKEVEQDRGEEYNCATDPADCVVVKGSGMHVLVVGDSHARMMSKAFTALAKERDLTLSMNVSPACPWQENLVTERPSRERREKCEEVRVGWYDEVLPKLNPDLVVLVGSPRAEPKYEGDIRHRDGRDEPLARAFTRASKQTLRKIDATGANALMLQSFVMPDDWEPNDCLTGGKKPEKCAVPLPFEQTVDDGVYKSLAPESPDWFSVNLNPALCPTAPMCRAVLDGEIVWRNSSHYTAEYAKSRRNEIWKLIRRSDALDDIAAS